jgi:hypothetical protein
VSLVNHTGCTTRWGGSSQNLVHGGECREVHGGEIRGVVCEGWANGRSQQAREHGEGDGGYIAVQHNGGGSSSKQQRRSAPN